MGKVMIIDVAKCNGCYNCQIVCKDEHVGNDWTPIAKPQPDTGQFWTHVEEITRGQVPKVKMAYMHSICQHCDDAPCMKACGAKAIYKRPDGIVIIDPDQVPGTAQLSRCLSLQGGHLLQLGLEHCPEVHLLRPSDRPGLEGDPLL